MNPSIELDGLREAQAALRRFGGTPQDAKKMNLEVVDEIIYPEAQRRVAVRSGALKASMDTDATAVYGYILAGDRGDVPYAGVNHFGWSSRGLGRNLTGSLKQRRQALRSANDRSGMYVLTDRATNKAARYSVDRKGKKAVRGGPYPPNPFIYDAIDDRGPEVFTAYERQVEHRAKIEDLL